MIKVKYKKYYNDFKNSMETKIFYSLDDLADWLFGMVNGKYDSFKIYFVNPDTVHTYNGKLHLDNSCISSSDDHWHYWVEQIERDGKIIYSTGKFTNGISYWNEDIKQWLRECRNRINNPQFNFG